MAEMESAIGFLLSRKDGAERSKTELLADIRRYEGIIAERRKEIEHLDAVMADMDAAIAVLTPADPTAKAA